VTSDNAQSDGAQPRGSTSDNTQPPADPPRRGRRPTRLPPDLEDVLARYAGELAKATMLDADTLRAYTSRVRGYLAWLDQADVDGDPLREARARDGAVRDFRTHLQTVAERKPTTINTTLAAISDFYTRTGLGPPDVTRLDLPQGAPRALSTKDTTRWLRAVERWLNPRDRVIALIPFYAGLRIGETVALNTTDVQLSARKGQIIVRSGKGRRYREVPLHAVLREQLALWINDERPGWPGATTSTALLLNRRGGRLTSKGATDILAAIAGDAGIPDDFSPHVLRHCFGTTLVRDGNDLVIVAELMGHARLETTRGYALPTAADRQRAINSLPIDR
jgi:site-specific recombinase XerD